MLAIDFSRFPELRTERLLFRELEPSDAKSLYAMRSDERVMRHIGRPRATSLQDAIDLIERIACDRASNNGMTWGMQLAGSNELIGTIGFYRLKPEHFTGEVGYLLHPDHWGRGLMSEALDLVTNHGFGRIGFHRIEAITAPENQPSRRVLERCGYRLEGILRGNYHWQGAQLDSALYGRLRTD
jgi:ribosomal-protein-alanine N-acetyltransferase